MYTHLPSKAFETLDDVISNYIHEAITQQQCAGVVEAFLAIKTAMGAILVDRVPGSFQEVGEQGLADSLQGVFDTDGIVKS